MKPDERLRLLALRRERLVLRSATQRELLKAQWQSATMPLQTVSGLAARWRRWLAPAALVGAPLGVLLGRRLPLGRLVRLALLAWPLARSLHQWLKR
jgi:hypothetical protein